MGNRYSAEQKVQFEPYRVQMDRAVNDRDYNDFLQVRDKISADLVGGVP